MDVNEYLGLFLDEAQEHIQSVNTQLLKLEQSGSMDAVQEIFRSAHTLKGMAATMGYESVANLTHEMESALDLVRGGKKASNQSTSARYDVHGDGTNRRDDCPH